jgi:hypothetical protein
VFPGKVCESDRGCGSGTCPLSWSPPAVWPTTGPDRSSDRGAGRGRQPVSAASCDPSSIPEHDLAGLGRHPGTQSCIRCSSDRRPLLGVDAAQRWTHVVRQQVS